MTTMKKSLYIFVALSAILVACNPKDDFKNIDQKSIVGKWKLSTFDNQPVLTDNRVVYTFDANGLGTQTISQDLQGLGERAWYMQQDLKYTLYGNALNTNWIKSTAVMEWKATVSSIQNDYFITSPSRTFLNTDVFEDLPQATWKRVAKDYSDDIVGLWEGRTCTGITYGDANHRWLYLPSGQYYYYKQDSLDGKWTGKWVIGENALNEYDVDGDYLACRWKQTADAKEDREFWDIAIHGNNMEWNALRQDTTSGKKFDASFTMERISPTQDEAQKGLIGKWVAYMIDGDSILTDEKSVHTFFDNGIVQYTISDKTKDMEAWHNRLQLSYSLTGSYLVEKGLDKNSNVVQWRSALAELNDKELLLYAFSSSRDVTTKNKPYNEIRLQRIDADYRQMILCGTDSIWKGIDGEGKYGDYQHLWEYQGPDAIGTCRYIYYSPDSITGEWENDDAEPGKYMVDGNWLATGWKEKTGKYEYEWWDIEIVGDTMKWSGIREDGMNRFTLVKVPKSTVGPFKE